MSFGIVYWVFHSIVGKTMSDTPNFTIFIVDIDHSQSWVVYDWLYHSFCSASLGYLAPPLGKSGQCHRSTSTSSWSSCLRRIKQWQSQAANNTTSSKQGNILVYEVYIYIYVCELCVWIMCVCMCIIYIYIYHQLYIYIVAFYMFGASKKKTQIESK